MENRISGRFVVNGHNLEEVDSRQAVVDLLLSSLGAKTGRIVELTITAKTTAERPWLTCTGLGYYGEELCGTLLAPNTTCDKKHYHRPAWELDADGAEPVCTECARLAVTPSRPFDPDEKPGYRYSYNHDNAPDPTED